MKKILLTSLFLLYCTTMVMAQGSSICGDWIGVYNGCKLSEAVDEDGDHYLVDADYKAYLRIKIIDNHYSVRMKTRIADESEPFKYSPECQIEHASENGITWIFDLGNDYDWSPTAKEQGIRIGHTHNISRCSVTLENGVLHYSEVYFCTYYDKQGREITTKKFDNKSFNLYKDDSDW